MQFLINSDGPRRDAGALAWIVVAVSVVLLGFAFARLRERPEFQGRGEANPFRAIRDVLRNRHARLLLIVFAVENVGTATIAVLTYYVATYVVGTPERTLQYILCYMFASIGFTPAWLPLSRIFGKKNLWGVSILLTGAA